MLCCIIWLDEEFTGLSYKDSIWTTSPGQKARNFFMQTIRSLTYWPTSDPHFGLPFLSIKSFYEDFGWSRLYLVPDIGPELAPAGRTTGQLGPAVGAHQVPYVSHSLNILPYIWSSPSILREGSGSSKNHFILA